MQVDNHASAPRAQYSFHAVVAVMSTVLVLAVVAALTYSAHRGAQVALGSVADDTIAQVARLLDEKLGRIFEPADNQLRLLAHTGLGEAATLGQRLERLPIAREALVGNPLIEALFVGYDNGDFVLYRPIDSEPLRAAFDAPQRAELLVQTVTRDAAGRRLGEYRFFNTEGDLLEVRALAGYDFDPRTRPWYRAGMASKRTVLTDPYVFFTTGEVGVTLARRTAEGSAVIGLDATVATLTAEIEALLLTPSTELAVVDRHGTVIAYHDVARLLIDDTDGPRLVTIDELAVPSLRRAFRDGTGTGERAQAAEDGREWQLVRMPLAPVGSLELSAVLAIPDDELFAGARAVVAELLAIALAIFVLSIPIGWWLTRHAVAPLQRLAERMRVIEAFDFTPQPRQRSWIREIDRLEVATERMRGTIANFMQTSLALGGMRDTDRLLDTILGNAVNTVDARFGAIYLMSEANGDVQLELRRSGGAEEETLIERETWFPPHCVAGDDSLIGRVAASRRTLGIAVAQGWLFATPLRNRQGELLGVLAVLLEPDAAGGDPRMEKSPRTGFIEALSASAAVALETRDFIAAQKRLLESIIQLIAAAIDAKSPYTGGHCQRVPELTKMIARAAEQASNGPYADFSLSGDEREALHIGAWLHDCGKITTPEHIVDKATKLECIYDRIHEIRMRFEVLKRDAHITALQARLAGQDAEATEMALRDELVALDADFAFVAECNLGGERMDEAALARLRRIATRRWSRTLSDRIGVSALEAGRKAAEPEPALPASEPLLSDAPWHCLPRAESERFGEDNPWGFRMEVPELKQNLGELYNLSVLRGTLTTEDRYIINHHMIQTIIMLSKLPFPPHLANVPEIAGGHHERMDGKGYPRGLRREDMSVLARAMAIADVFEALTAGDRPYKRPNTVAEALSLMAGMVAGHHLDPDLFRLFVESDVVRAYAERFLAPEQLDTVDVESLLVEAGISPPPASF